MPSCAVVSAVVLALEHKHRTPQDSYHACSRGWPHTLPCRPNMRNSHCYLCRTAWVWVLALVSAVVSAVVLALVLELDHKYRTPQDN